MIINISMIPLWPYLSRHNNKTRTTQTDTDGSSRMSNKREGSLMKKAPNTNRVVEGWVDMEEAYETGTTFEQIPWRPPKSARIGHWLSDDPAALVTDPLWHALGEPNSCGSTGRMAREQKPSQITPNNRQRASITVSDVAVYNRCNQSRTWPSHLPLLLLLLTVVTYIQIFDILVLLLNHCAYDNLIAIHGHF